MLDAGMMSTSFNMSSAFSLSDSDSSNRAPLAFEAAIICRHVWAMQRSRDVVDRCVPM